MLAAGHSAFGLMAVTRTLSGISWKVPHMFQGLTTASPLQQVTPEAVCWMTSLKEMHHLETAGSNTDMTVRSGARQHGVGGGSDSSQVTVRSGARQHDAFPLNCPADSLGHQKKVTPLQVRM